MSALSLHVLELSPEGVTQQRPGNPGAEPAHGASLTFAGLTPSDLHPQFTWKQVNVGERGKWAGAWPGTTGGFLDAAAPVVGATGPEATEAAVSTHAGGTDSSSHAWSRAVHGALPQFSHPSRHLANRGMRERRLGELLVRPVMPELGG